MNDWIDLCDDKDVKARAKFLDRMKKILFYITCALAFVCEYCIILHCEENAGVGGIIVLTLLIVGYNACAVYLECLKGAVCACIWFNNHQHTMIERRFDEIIEALPIHHYTYKGTVCTVEQLYSLRDQLIGDIYIVSSSDTEYYWDGHAWNVVKDTLRVPGEEHNNIDCVKITELDGDWKGPRG